MTGLDVWAEHHNLIDLDKAYAAGEDVDHNKYFDGKDPAHSIVEVGRMSVDFDLLLVAQLAPHLWIVTIIVTD